MFSFAVNPEAAFKLCFESVSGVGDREGPSSQPLVSIQWTWASPSSVQRVRATVRGDEGSMVGERERGRRMKMGRVDGEEL